MPGTTSTAVPSFSHDQHHNTDAAKRKGEGEGDGWQSICILITYQYSWRLFSNFKLHFTMAAFCKKNVQFKLSSKCFLVFVYLIMHHNNFVGYLCSCYAMLQMYQQTVWLTTYSCDLVKIDCVTGPWWRHDRLLVNQQSIKFPNLCVLYK